MSEFVAYYRVSTQRQGRSGLGLEAQKMAVEHFVENDGGRIVSIFEEIESGKNNDRPKLAAALSFARRAKAILITAKLDRIGRDAAHTLNLLSKSGVDIIDVSDPHMSKLTAGIKAVIAEDEAARISQRTKAALQAAKKRGTKLGSHREGHWTPERHKKRLKALEQGRSKSVEVRKQKATEAVADLLPLLYEWKAEGCSHHEISRRLNAKGERTVRGGLWQCTTVSRLLKNSGPYQEEQHTE